MAKINFNSIVVLDSKAIEKINDDGSIKYYDDEKTTIYIPALSSLDVSRTNDTTRRKYLQNNNSVNDFIKTKKSKEITVSTNGTLFMTETVPLSITGSLSNEYFSPLMFTRVAALAQYLNSKTDGDAGIESLKNNQISLFDLGNVGNGGSIGDVIAESTKVGILNGNDRVVLDESKITSYSFSISAEDMLIKESFGFSGKESDNDDFVQFTRIPETVREKIFTSLKIKSAKLGITAIDESNNTQLYALPFTDYSISLNFPVDRREGYLNQDEENGTVITNLKEEVSIDITVVDDKELDGSFVSMLKKNPEFIGNISLEIELDNIMLTDLETTDPTKANDKIGGKLKIEAGNGGKNTDSFRYTSLRKGFSSEGTPVYTMSFELSSYIVSMLETYSA